MRRALAIITALSMLAPTAAWACYNEYAIEGDDGVKRIAQIEFHLRYEQYWLAHQAIPLMMGGFRDQRLEDRAWDASHLLDLRWHKEPSAAAVSWFRERVLKWSNPQRLAWLAEALAADEQGRSEARGILRALDAKDLMPDGRAYEVLARITTGAEHIRSLAMCRKRAVVKWICGPAPRTI